MTAASNWSKKVIRRPGSYGPRRNSGGLGNGRTSWPSRPWWQAVTRCASERRGLRPRDLHAPPLPSSTTRIAKSSTTGTYTPLAKRGGWPGAICCDRLASCRKRRCSAFEYGYASNDPNTLVIWEAQFGDFVNGAQVVIDQFIASGEVKWGRVPTALTLMLPHGYEGQGPEHSSARLERFMQLSRRHQYAGGSANHRRARSSIILRRQMVRKSAQAVGDHDAQVAVACNKDAASPLVGIHQRRISSTVIPEPTIRSIDRPTKCKRLIACSGKVYYDLVRKRRDEKKSGSRTVAVIRDRAACIRSPTRLLQQNLRSYPNATDIVWCQDEPQNQGAWFFVQHYIHENMTGWPEAGLFAGRAGLRVAGRRLLRICTRSSKKHWLDRCVRETQGVCAHQVSPHRCRKSASPQGRRIAAGQSPFRRGRLMHRINSDNNMAIVEVKVPQLSESVCRGDACCSGRKNPVRRSPSTKS